MPLDTFQEDECCGAALNAAALAGLLDEADEWTHEDCGQVWRAKMIGDMRHWAPACEALRIK